MLSFKIFMHVYLILLSIVFHALKYIMMVLIKKLEIKCISKLNTIKRCNFTLEIV